MRRPGLGLVAPVPVDPAPITYAPTVELGLEYDPGAPVELVDAFRRPWEPNVPGMLLWFGALLATAAVINHAFQGERA